MFTIDSQGEGKEDHSGVHKHPGAKKWQSLLLHKGVNWTPRNKDQRGTILRTSPDTRTHKDDSEFWVYYSLEFSNIPQSYSHSRGIVMKIGQNIPTDYCPLSLSIAGKLEEGQGQERKLQCNRNKAYVTYNYY